MSIQPLNTSISNSNAQNLPKRNPSFTSNFNPVVALMDGIDRGGYAASFILQDMLGMAAPRVISGYTRNSDETGKPNYAFATKEAIRELLSGPSTFLIPLALFTAVKKFGGSSNGVRADFIKGFGDDFEKFVKTQTPETLQNTVKIKEKFYVDAFKNLIDTSLQGKIPPEELDNIAKDYSKRLIEIETKSKSKGFFKNFAGKKVAGSTEDLTSSLITDFSNLKKSHLSANDDVLSAAYKGAKGNLKTNIKKFFTDLRNCSEDFASGVSKYVEKNTVKGVDDFVKKLTLKRFGSRVVSNIGIYISTIGFMMIIPKLYKSKNGNPGLAGLPVKGQPGNGSQPSGDKEVNDASK